jgi:hypothetical protein
LPIVAAAPRSSSGPTQFLFASRIVEPLKECRCTATAPGTNRKPGVRNDAATFSEYHPK